ncbi:hypothetical protein E1264_33490 [Actinomadura sp. KC216]|uniref:hypothetical protein n=1 Tax=Actinomadura sp. KC216 TaxID=2530370 RepID=UPI0010518344|nr:hypothetical protein [Actinomadura sp. KC216]TDB80853.1 hypothetical protein E1264_33490 [Actinomadura sp. KC216]
MGRGNPELADHPANQVLIDYLQAQAQRPSTPHDLFTLDGWTLHTHPDLLERFQEVVPDDTPIIPLFGVPALAANGIIAIAALGTSWLMVRLPQLPDDVETLAPIPPLAEAGWHSVNAWQTGTPTAMGKQRLTALMKDALRHSGSLNP